MADPGKFGSLHRHAVSHVLMDKMDEGNSLFLKSSESHVDFFDLLLHF